MFFFQKAIEKIVPQRSSDGNGFLVSGGFAVHRSVRCSYLNLTQKDNASPSIQFEYIHLIDSNKPLYEAFVMVEATM